MTVHLSVIGNAFQFLNTNGRPLSGGKLFAYAAGTTTPQATYTDSLGTIPNTNPIIFNSDGRLANEIWLTDGLAYKFVLQDSGSSALATYDNLTGIGDASSVVQANILATLASTSPTPGATLIGYKSTLSSAVAATVETKLLSIVDGKVDFGMVGDGATDNTSAFQAALNSLTAGGELILPPGNYVTQSVTPKANTTIRMLSGAALVAKHGAANQLFALSNTAVVTTNLTTGLSGAFQVTVASTATFAAGHRVVISAGTFTGSGIEEGPIEFNTVQSVDDGTHMTMQSPMQYSYSAFGIPGAAPRVISLGLESAMLRNFRITGGTIKPFAGFDSIYFNFKYMENFTVDHVFFDGVGSGLATGGSVSHFNFHDNIVSGSALVVGGQMFDIATVCESFFIDNVFNIRNDADPNGQFNHLVFEVTCRDNLIQGNLIGPIRSTVSGGVELTFFSFNNRILDNVIWGTASDIAANKATLGIRTFGNGSNIGGGNIIRGNKLHNLMTGIADNQAGSVIGPNNHENDALNALSVGVNIGTDVIMAPILLGSVTNIEYPVRTNAGAPAGFGLFSGSGAPVATGVGGFGTPGALFLQKNAQVGRAFHRCENVNGTVAWIAANRLVPLAFANLPAAAAVDPGEMFWCTDGTPASDPLVGAGAGCIAIRKNGAAYRGI